MDQTETLLDCAEDRATIQDAKTKYEVNTALWCIKMAWCMMRESRFIFLLHSSNLKLETPSAQQPFEVFYLKSSVNYYYNSKSYLKSKELLTFTFTELWLCKSWEDFFFFFSRTSLAIHLLNLSKGIYVKVRFVSCGCMCYECMCSLACAWPLCFLKSLRALL